MKIVIFAACSLGIVFLSRSSLLNPRSHGFFRFFAFESLLALILMNLDSWFDNPFSPYQIASWLLFLSSIALAVHGFYLLRMVGEPSDGFEDTTALVRVGAYKYIRHPLYASLLLFGLGVFLKGPSLPEGVLCLSASACLLATARTEERENIVKFGHTYALYMETTKMFIPFIV